MPTGSTALGRYVLYDEIASGGMATVHLARLVGAAGFLRTVAVKRLHAHLAKDPDFVSMFVDEARMAARIQHPNVVQTLDVVQVQGEVFLVMDYVHGESLSRLWRALREEDKRIPVSTACAIMGNVLSGLHAAHEAKTDRGAPLGLVHRDVSPQNVLVGLDGVARLIDFGVAKAAMRIQSTEEGRLKGKLAYMAPEQVELRPVDRRSDVFAASIVFWEALTGARLFDTPQPAATVAKIMGGAIPPPSSLAPDVPHVLDAIVLRGLERDPAARFSTALDMAKSIEVAVQSMSPRRVGEWVESIAGSALGKRAARVAEVESDSSSHSAVLGGSGPLVVGAAQGSEAATEISVSLALEPASEPMSASKTPHGSARASRKVAPWLAGLGVLAVVAAVATYRLRQPTEPAAPAPVPSVEVQSPIVAAPPARATPPTTVGAPASTSSGAVEVSTKPSAGVVPRPSPPPARPHSTPQCQPNYSVDDRGIKHFKPECLQR